MSEMKNGSDDFVQRIAYMTRMLRVSMETLGLNKEVEKAAQAMPDTRDRLDYVAKMNVQAANRVLHAIDVTTPLLKEVSDDAKQLEAALDERMEKGDIKDESIVSMTKQYLTLVEKNNREIQGQMLEITMAQDFQDLTCQVINKMTDVVKEIEHQLLVLLSECSDGSDPSEIMARLAQNEWDDKQDDDSLLNGPQIKPTEGDAVSDQSQVDDLLGELGL